MQKLWQKYSYVFKNSKNTDAVENIEQSNKDLKILKSNFVKIENRLGRSLYFGRPDWIDNFTGWIIVAQCFASKEVFINVTGTCEFGLFYLWKMVDAV